MPSVYCCHETKKIRPSQKEFALSIIAEHKDVIASNHTLQEKIE